MATGNGHRAPARDTEPACSPACPTFMILPLGLGNAAEAGLERILSGVPFRDLAKHTVDTGRRCRSCEVRYLCGGPCRAWVAREDRSDLDAAPSECTHLEATGRAIHEAALAYLRISEPGGPHA